MSLGNAVAYPPDATASEPPTLLDSFGLWTLDRLGQKDVVLDDEAPKASVPYALPLGASQGPDTWYLIRLHLRVRFTPAAKGIAWFFAAHNSFASALFEFKRDADGGAVTWNTSGMIDGSVRRTTTASEVEFRFANYLQYAAVQPGLNTLTLRIEQSNGPVVEEVRVLDDSGIEVSPLSPARLELSTSLSRTRLPVRETVRIRVNLRNVGDRAVRYAVVALEYDRDSLRVLGRKVRRLPRIAGHSSAQAKFRLQALRPGRHLLGVLAGSTSNSPGSSFWLTVTR